MRIVIDLQCAQSGSRLGGIGRYSSELTKAMLRNAREHEFLIVLNSMIAGTIPDVRYAFSNLLPQEQIRVFTAPHGIAEHGNARAKVRASELVRESFIADLSPDITHVSSLFEGLQEDVLTSVGNIVAAQRTSVTLYDLIPLVQKEKYLSDKGNLDYYLQKVEYLKAAGLLLSISEYSKLEAIDLLGIDPQFIENISSAADERFKPTDIHPASASALRKKYSIKNRYLMYTGSFDQRKNHENLIRAFALVPKKLRQGVQLLIVGNGWDGMYRNLRELGKRQGLEDDDLIFPGHVEESELVPLYCLCDLFVFPSLAEGFGLPALEAMSCGTPTIGSNCTSLPEVIGWADAQFNPRNADSIAELISRVLRDVGFREQLKQHGLRQAKKFSWDASAKKAIDGFEELFRRAPCDSGRITVPSTDLGVRKIAKLNEIGSLSEQELGDVARSLCVNRDQWQVRKLLVTNHTSNLRVGWVSTWNTRCGIASYSRFLLEKFPARVTIFAPVTEWTIRSDEENVRRCWRIDGGDSLAELRKEIIAADIEVLVIQFNYGFFEFSAFDRFLQVLAHDGIRVLVTFHSTKDPSDDKQLRQLDSLSRCYALVVHSRADIDCMRNMGVGQNVAFMPQGVVEIAPTEVEVKRMNGSFVVATYGFALPGKGLEQVVEAIAILLEEERNVELRMINAEYPVPESKSLIESLRAKIAEIGIADRVTIISDYLSEEDSLGYLKTANLIVYAYQRSGESSSAAVRMGLASGVLVAVTPMAVFDDVSTCVYRLPGLTPAQIATGIVEILVNTDAVRQAAYKSNSVLWSKAHGFASISRYLLEIVVRPRVELAAPLPKFFLNPSSKKLVFLADSPPLQTIVGQGRVGVIDSTKTAGYLLCGPFISVAHGKYIARVNGTIGAAGPGIATADVAIQAGTQLLSECEIRQSFSDDTLATLTFTVPEGGCRDLEVRVKVDECSELSIKSIVLEPA